MVAFISVHDICSPNFKTHGIQKGLPRLPFNKLWHIPPPHRGRPLCLGVKIRIEGQVLSQAARLISLCAPSARSQNFKKCHVDWLQHGDTVQTEEGAVGGERRERGSGD